MVETKVDMIFLHKSKNASGKIFASSKNGAGITPYIGLHVCFWKYFQRLLSLFLDIPKSSALLPLK